jgi:hypothetical protein
MSRMPRIIPLTAVAIGGGPGDQCDHARAGPLVRRQGLRRGRRPNRRQGRDKPAVSPNGAASAAPDPGQARARPGLRAHRRRAGQGGRPVAGRAAGPAEPRQRAADSWTSAKSDLDTQVQLIAAAEAKLDARIAGDERAEGRHHQPGWAIRPMQQQQAETGTAGSTSTKSHEPQGRGAPGSR